MWDLGESEKTTHTQRANTLHGVKQPCRFSTKGRESAALSRGQCSQRSVQNKEASKRSHSPSRAQTDTTGGARISGMSSSTCVITPWAYSLGDTPEMSDLLAATTSARPCVATFEEPQCLGGVGGGIGRGRSVCIWLASFAVRSSTTRTRTDRAEEEGACFAD